MLEPIKDANLAVRFLLELCVLDALGSWGFPTGGGGIAKAGLGSGAPLLAAVVWGALVAPNAPVELLGAIRLVVELVVFGAAVAALFAVGWALVVVYAINRLLMAVWDQ